MTVTRTAPHGLPDDFAVIFVIGGLHGVSHFFHLMLPPLFPWLMPEFGLDFTGAGMLMTVFFVVSGIGQALAGFVVDRIGARPVLLAGLSLFVAAGVALAFADGYAGLLLAAVLAGAGNSVFHPADFSILNHRVSPARLGHAFSVHGLAGNLGWALAPLLMSGVAGLAGWRSAALAAAALGLLALGLALGARRWLTVQAPLPVSAASAGRGAPGGALDFLESRLVWLCFLFFVLTTMAFGALQNFLPALLRHLHGLTLALATTALSAYLLGGAAGILAGGRLAARHADDLDRLIARTLLVAIALAWILALVPLPGWLVLPAVVVMGVASGIAGPSRDLLVRRAAMQGAGAAAYGRVYGFVYSGLDAGLALGPLLFGRIMDAGADAWVLLGVGGLQGLAVASALRVGRRSAPAAG